MQKSTGLLKIIWCLEKLPQNSDPQKKMSLVMVYIDLSAPGSENFFPRIFLENTLVRNVWVKSAVELGPQFFLNFSWC
jgi:hypothetical protein